MESHVRTITKSLSWRVIATVVTFSVAWAFTGKLDLAIEIGLLDTVIKLFAYYFHERSWNKIGFGRQKTPEYNI